MVLLRDEFPGAAVALADHLIAPINSLQRAWHKALSMALPQTDGTGEVQLNPVNEAAAVCVLPVLGRVGARFMLEHVGWGEIAGLLVRYQDDANHIRVYCENDCLWLKHYRGGQEDARVIEGVFTPPGVWFDLVVELSSGQLAVKFNGAVVLTYGLVTRISVIESGAGLLLRSGMAAVHADDFYFETLGPLVEAGAVVNG